MSARIDSHARATSLLADISGSDDFLPRREHFTLWLERFVERTSVSGARVDPLEIEDLAALDDFLRTRDLHQRAGPRPT